MDYMAVIEGAFKAGVIPHDYDVTLMDVAHDDDCAIYLGRGCSCKPDISFVKGGKRFYLMKNGEKIYGTSLG